ncbi:Uncharacterised protein [Arcanobacterium haemolyticum]|nr:Uncharacterised protein [Arcanobacterium haemolyticum]
MFDKAVLEVCAIHLFLHAYVTETSAWFTTME